MRVRKALVQDKMQARQATGARNGCTSNLGRITSKQAIWEKSRLGAETMDAMKNSPESLHLRFGHLVAHPVGRAPFV